MANLSQYSLLKTIREKSGLETMEPREKWIVFGGVLFVICFLVFQQVLMPFFEAKTGLEKSIDRKQEELVTIKELQKEYLDLKNEAGTIQTRLKARDTGFTLFTFLDEQAEDSQIKKQIKYMKPSIIEGTEMLNEVMVEMKIQQIHLGLLVNFLKLIESESNVVFVRRISIQEAGGSQGYLDVILQIVTFEEKG